MKKLFFITTIIIACITSTYSQSNYYKGFYNGYKEGYCHDQGVGCIEPNPPNAPLPKTNEELNSYKDGYNRGFKMGQKAQDSSTTSNYKEGYKTSSPNFEDHIYKPNYDLSLLVAKKKIQHNKLTNKLIEVMIEVNDELVEDRRYDDMISINGRSIRVGKEQSNKQIIGLGYFYKSLAYVGKYYETNIADELDKAYDNAVRAESYGQNIDQLIKQIHNAKKFEREKENINYNKYYSFDDPPFEVSMYAKPNVSSNIIYKCPKDSKIKILRKVNDIFFEVVINNQRGFVTKFFVK